MNKKIIVKNIFITIGITISLVIFSVPIFLICLDSNYKNKRLEIIDCFSSWCDSARYVSLLTTSSELEFFDKEINLKDDIRDPFLKNNKNIKSVMLQKSILNAGDCFYFCCIEETTDSRQQLSIYRSDFNCSPMVRVQTIGEPISGSRTSFDSAFGYGETGYFRVESNYYEFNFVNMELRELDKNDERANLCIFDNYLNYYRVSKNTCRIATNRIVFNYDNKKYEFDQQLINEDELFLIKRYGFSPNWCLSFKDGLTSIVFYEGSRLLGYGECLICTYDRDANKVVDYQLIVKTNLSSKNKVLFPYINLN